MPSTEPSQVLKLVSGVDARLIDCFFCMFLLAFSGQAVDLCPCLPHEKQEAVVDNGSASICCCLLWFWSLEVDQHSASLWPALLQLKHVKDNCCLGFLKGESSLGNPPSAA